MFEHCLNFPESNTFCANTPLLFCVFRFHVEEEGKGVDADGNKVKADKEAVKVFRASLRLGYFLSERQNLVKL